MTEPNTPSKSSKIVHWIALVLLFLMMAQPTVDNIRAMMNGAYVMGDITVEVTLAQMSLHIIAMLVGWVGLVWFFQKKKRGAYTSIIAHALGFVAASTQTQSPARSGFARSVAFDGETTVGKAAMRFFFSVMQFHATMGCA